MCHGKDVPMGDVIQFPQPPAHGQPATACKVTLHCEADGGAVVTIKPCPPGVTPRRAFTLYDEAWPYADQLARRHTRIDGKDGSWSHSVTMAGPEVISG